MRKILTSFVLMIFVFCVVITSGCESAPGPTRVQAKAEKNVKVSTRYQSDTRMVFSVEAESPPAVTAAARGDIPIPAPVASFPPSSERKNQAILRTKAPLYDPGRSFNGSPGAVARAGAGINLKPEIVQLL